MDDQFTLISESGVIGGVPGEGGDFGAHRNPEAINSQTDHFSFFDQGGLDVGVYGLPEVQENGDVNTTFLNGTMAGVGGFPHIAANAKTSIFMGAFTAGKLRTHIENGKLVIDQEGRFKKFVRECVQVSFSAKEALRKGKRMLYISERAVLEYTEKGFILLEIAPGVDLQKDVLENIEFDVILPDGGPKLMDPALFEEDWGGLKDII